MEKHPGTQFGEDGEEDVPGDSEGLIKKTLQG